jgi:NADH-quinone oxidoreductase subunit M
MGGAGLFFGLASLGLPGLGNFVGEFLVLMGAYHVSITLTAVAATGLVIATMYALWMVQRTFFGARADERKVPDLTLREVAVMGVMVASLVWIGMYPQPILNTASRSLETLRKNVQIMKADGRINRPIYSGEEHDSR